MADQDDSSDDLKAANAVDLHRTIREEGEAEIDRPAGALIWSGLAGGIAINASLIAEGALHAHLPDAPWRTLVVSLGYPAGFILVVLGRLQFFTESTITAMLPLATRPTMASLRGTLRLWGLVLFANMIGAACAAAAVAYGLLGDEALRGAMIAVSAKILELGPLATFINAVPAGFLIAMIAWTLPNARGQSLFLIGVVTYLIGVAGFSHSIVGSVEAFLLVFSGQTDAVTAVFGRIAPAVLGNLVGGAGLFALLAHAQVRSDAQGAQP